MVANLQRRLLVVPADDPPCLASLAPRAAYARATAGPCHPRHLPDVRPEGDELNAIPQNDLGLGLGLGYTRLGTIHTQNLTDIDSQTIVFTMYGKSYEQMYTGSMVGAGLNVFAVWNYIITNTHFGVIELNPKLLNAILGGELSEVEDALEFLSSPDPDSRSKEEEGRRIVREGQFQYRVVNWNAYQTMKNDNALRNYNRIKQAEYRERERELLQDMTPEQKAVYLNSKSQKAKKAHADVQRAVRARAAAEIAQQCAVQHLDEIQNQPEYPQP